ncbi:hypothetical protein P7K49_037008, partial [Saguinus oedipus]
MEGSSMQWKRPSLGAQNLAHVSHAPHSCVAQANLPLLQRELLHCARLAKQTPAQYLAQHEQLLLDASASSPVGSSELLLEVNENGKRRTPDRYPWAPGIWAEGAVFTQLMLLSS